MPAGIWLAAGQTEGIKAIKFPLHFARKCRLPLSGEAIRCGGDRPMRSSAPRVYLKTPDAPGQRAFSRRAASFFLEIRQYSCEKMSCAARKFLAAGHIGSFQIHPRPHKATLLLYLLIFTQINSDRRYARLATASRASNMGQSVME